MTAPETAEYWDERGRAAALSELDAVCYPGAPDFLNRYAAWSQRRAVERLLTHAGPLAGVRTLDVGCGTGRWSRLLAGRGARVVGVDRSEAMLAEARRRSPGVEFRRMDAAALELADDSFDLALAVAVIQHLGHERQPRAIAELVRVVRPGGLVLAVDRAGRASDFAARHGTFPRPRADWLALWHAAGAEPVRSVGQEFSYPLRVAGAGRRRRGRAEEVASGPPRRRGARGWRRCVLRLLVAGCYVSEIVVGTVAPDAPAEHLAVLYRVGTGPS